MKKDQLPCAICRGAISAAGTLFITSALSCGPALGSNSPLPETAEAPHRSTPSPDFDPLLLTDEMRQFADERIGRNLPRFQRLLELQEAIFDPETGLGITYGSTFTRTAAETFRERNGNCLSFTLLFSSLARALGLDSYFVEVDEVTGWSQRGEVDLSHWHMYVEVVVEGRVIPVDFLPWSNTRYRSSRRIGEDRVKAHYHNNIGVDFLTADDIDSAMERFALALELDSGFQPARINLAVALRRIGSPELAESALLEVLDVETRNAVAASNLASLYQSLGRHREAQKWIDRRARFLDQNPFHHFRLGLRALAADRPDQARGHFRRAIRLQRDEAIFYEELAESHLRLNHPRRARRALRNALDFTTDPDRRRLIETRLEQIHESGKNPT